MSSPSFSSLHSLHQFRRFEPCILQACEAYERADGDGISWRVDRAAENLCADYVRNCLRKYMLYYLDNADISSPASRETVDAILKNWVFRSIETHTVEVGPRKRGYRKLQLCQDPDDVSSSDSLQLTVDGTRLNLVQAICLLKNHEQIPASTPVKLTNFNTAFEPDLLTTYPNIELMPDLVAGVPTPDWILI